MPKYSERQLEDLELQVKNLQHEVNDIIETLYAIRSNYVSHYDIHDLEDKVENIHRWCEYEAKMNQWY